MTNGSTLDRNEWAARLDEATKKHEGQAVTIQVVDLTYGHNAEVEKLPFNFDHKDDVVTIAVGGLSTRYPIVLRHLIVHRTEVDLTDRAMRVAARDATIPLVTFFTAHDSA
jgi:hypothetical protein